MCEVHVLGVVFAVISAHVFESPQNVLLFLTVSTHMFNLWAMIIYTYCYRETDEC